VRVGVVICGAASIVRTVEAVPLSVDRGTPGGVAIPVYLTLAESVIASGLSGRGDIKPVSE
jgi:hypothetical protein